VEGVWVLIGADLAIFCLLFGSFMHDRYGQPELFETARHALNFTFGGVDTLILLTSSWFVALAVDAAKRDDPARVTRFLFGGFITGIAFMVSKSIEYTEKFASGITPGTNGFFMWYFTLTGIHLLHVVVGTSLLTALWLKCRRTAAVGGSVGGRRVFLESVASFWHLVDLLWIFLFPLLYLTR
jgi:nitric oxide reductase NorE protein